MKRIFRLVISVCLIAGLFAPSALSAKSGDQSSNNSYLSRLIALGHLWGKVKYFHPALAYRQDIDWDRALVEALPKVAEAKSKAEFQTAVEDMLGKLGDSDTRVSDGGGNAIAKTRFGYRMTDDGIIIVTVGSYFQLYGREAQQGLQRLAKDVPKAKGVVFDLRTDEPGGDYGNGALVSSFAPIERLLTSKRLETPAQLSRLYRGYESGSVFSSGQYQSGFFTQRSEWVTPAHDATDVPTVTILNENSALLSTTASKQAAGTGLVVFDGPQVDDGGRLDVVELGEDLSAHVRVSEPVFSDGTSGAVKADAIVGTDKYGSGSAIDVALGLIRNFKPSAASRPRLPTAVLARQDSDYSSMKYPAVEYRILAAYRIWNIINYFYPYKDLLPGWDDALEIALPQLLASKNAVEYNLAIAKMATQIHDSHSYVASDTLYSFFGDSMPPIRVRSIEGRLIVTHLYDPNAASSGVAVGDEVMRVDGEDARARLERYRQYIPASTDQSATDKATWSFMNGPAESTVTLALRNGHAVKDVRLTRKFQDYTTLYHRERSGEVLRLLKGNIGYADLDRMPDSMIDEMLEKFKNTRGIIFDMRGYPAGSFFWSLSPRLVLKPGARAALLETPLVGPFSSPGAVQAEYQLIQPPPSGKPLYKGKTVMLIDERTASQAEHTGLFFRAANGTKFIGTPTTGVDGEITDFSVPGGITIGFTGQSVRFPNGKQIQRAGLEPDIVVRPTVRGIRAGRDEVLEAAVAYLKK